MRAFLFACIALALFATPGLAAPIEAYGRLPSISRVQLSPDGKLVAYITQKNGEQSVRIEKLATHEMVGSVMSGGHKIRELTWAGSAHLVIVSSTLSKFEGMSDADDYFEGWQGVIFDIAARKVRPLVYTTDGLALPLLAGSPFVRTVDGKPVVFFEATTLVNSASRLGLFRTNLDTRTTRLVRTGDSNTADWLFDEDLKVLALFDFFGHNDARRLKVRHQGDLKILSMPEGSRKARLLGRGRTPQSVMVGYVLGDKNVVLEVSLDTLEWSPPLEVEPDNILVDPIKNTMIGYHALVGDEQVYTFYDPADQKAWNTVKEAYRGQIVSLASWSENRRVIAVHVDSLTDGPAYSYVDLDTKKGDWIGEAYEGLKPADISPVKSISYAAADGTRITGYLTTPHGAEARKLPLIVLPHGGPASRDTPGFDWWAQALASRGYAVLQANYRGSDGFGRAFLEAGHGEWGKKMQTDLSDGVRHLTAQGVIDPARVCIVGASYGGYAALAGAAIDRGVYRCAVSVNGVADLKRMLISDRERKGVSALRYWSEFMGVDGARDPDLAAISPAAQAAKVDIPVMLIHGRDDTVVLHHQSQRMYDAMRAAGKPVEFVTLKGEDHWLSNGETRMQMLQSLVAFVEKHNPPKPAAQTASLP